MKLKVREPLSHTKSRPAIVSLSLTWVGVLRAKMARAPLNSSAPVWLKRKPRLRKGGWERLYHPLSAAVIRTS